MQKKLFSSYVILIFNIVCFIGYHAINISQEYYINECIQHIQKEAKIVCEQLELLYNTGKSEILDDFIKQTANDLELQIMLMDKEKNIISDSDSKSDNNIHQYNLDKTKDTLSVKNMVNTKKGTIYSIDIPIVLDNEKMTLQFSKSLTGLNALRSDILIYIIISTIVIFFCSYYISKKILEPLNTLTNAVSEVSQGKYTKKIPVSTNDQIGYLTETFNHMSVKLNTTINALETENKRMEAIVNSMINGVVAIDKKNKILMINSQCCELFDIKNNYCKGIDFYEIFKNDDIKTLLETSISEKRNIVEIVILKSRFNGDKILRVYISTIFATKNQNNSLGTLLVFQDVTQIKKLEEMRSNFISNVTHELKTPLTSIMGFTDTLRSGAMNNQDMAKHFLEIIDIETHRLYRLIQDILSLSEIETRKKDTNMQYESIQEILHYIEGLLRTQAEEKGLQLIVECEEIPLYFCNKDKISQMFINLIENAIKYTEKGSVTVHCKYQGEYFVLQVKDTGIGIPQESIERIFERFYRVDKSRSRKAGGTGLGLSIVKHIMMLYNGKVKVESKEGIGTIFTITMPYKI